MQMTFFSVESSTKLCETAWLNQTGVNRTETLNRRLYTPSLTVIILKDKQNTGSFSSFLGKRDEHWVLGSDFEVLKTLHSHGRFSIVFELRKCNPWFSGDHSYLFESRILTEEKFKHSGCCIVRKILNEEYVVWWHRFLSARLERWWLFQDVKIKQRSSSFFQIQYMHVYGQVSG